MKNKKGFTLAEVLITLGIIGVVAAIATPALNSSVQKSKIGPMLKKFVSTMENANELILQDGDVDTLSDAANSSAEYINRINKHVTGTIDKDSAGNIKGVNSYGTIASYSGTAATGTENYLVYNLPKGDSIAVYAFGGFPTPVNGFKGHYANVFYDINGFANKPNVQGKDIFVFVVDNGGAVLPLGGEAARTMMNDEAGTYNWNKSDACENGKKPGESSQLCTGAIAENGWKVMYKY